MKYIGHQLISSDVSELSLADFFSAQKNLEIQVLEGALESIVQNVKDNNNSKASLITELDKLGKITSFFSEQGFQYSVEHTKNYLAQNIPAFSYQPKSKHDSDNFHDFDRELNAEGRKIIAESFIKNNPSHKDSLVAIVTDFYKISESSIFVEILNNVKDFYKHKDLVLNTSPRPKI